MTKFRVTRESNVITGHVLDVSRAPLLAALRRYDPQLYVKWNPSKRGARGFWELRRKPEYKTIRYGRFLDTPYRGRVYFPGDVFDFGEGTLAVPKFHETKFENHVKNFDYLTYDMVTWVAGHDIWQMKDCGFRGANFTKEAAYRQAKYEEKIDEDSDAEKQYMIKQHQTQFRDYAAFINAGGNPARLVDYWDNE